MRAAFLQRRSPMRRSHTQTIFIDAPREAVLDLVSDPTAFPRWASGFARAVRLDGPIWVVDTAEGEVRLRIRVSRELGTVDFLAADALPGRELGVFTRAVPNGHGCEYILTRFLPDGLTATEIDDEIAVVAVELQTVRALCERADVRAAAA
jgi:Polyketide cyclase / dehydrase and lipid transport